MTEEDIARIVERERRAILEGLESDVSFQNQDDKLAVPGSQGLAGGDSKLPKYFPPDYLVSHNDTQREQTPDAGSKRANELFKRSPLLLGVPIAAGPNVTKFMYVKVGEGIEEGEEHRNAASSEEKSKAHGFDPEAAAAGLCADLYAEKEELPMCLSSLAAALASR